MSYRIQKKKNLLRTRWQKNLRQKSFASLYLKGFHHAISTLLLCNTPRFNSIGYFSAIDWSILQCFRYRFILTVTWNIAKSILIITCFGHNIWNQPIGSYNTGSVIFRCTQTCLVSFLHIKIAVSLHIRIGYQRSRMISHHSPGIIGHTVPFRKDTTFLMLLYQ
mgnify:CR=1 FL=1